MGSQFVLLERLLAFLSYMKKFTNILPVVFFSNGTQTSMFIKIKCLEKV
jgi:hypothetical protein